MFGRVLVANRGEIASRICRTLAARGIVSVAVHTASDAGAPYLADADVAVAVDSYLDAKALVAAAADAGADAVHPGYGFLAENADFARMVAAAGLVWVGPPPEAIATMGDKVRAKATVAAAGVPVVPGSVGERMNDAELADAASEIGFPVLLKPSAGGGGKGMRRVARAEDLPAEITSARREARGAFGDDTLLVERWVSRPRHVEVQVFADTHGSVIHLGERECSLQRRHQKIVEEAPSPLLDAATREAMGQAAVNAAEACGYVGAGTVEFIVSADRPREFFFMEMNTRLQVEHPVTEAVTGLDLVDWQLRVAAGEPLPLRQAEVRLAGHAVEARIYAEDPARGFLPSTGTVLAVSEPAEQPWVRVDSSLGAGMVVGADYDPMLAKVIASGPDRETALARLRAALRSTAVLGVTTNVAFLQRLLGHPAVVAGDLDTELVERVAGELATDPSGERAALVAAALALALRRQGSGDDPWELADGWRVGDRSETVCAVVCGGQRVELGVTGSPSSGTVRVGEAAVAAAGRFDGEWLVVTSAGETSRWCCAFDGDAVWVGRHGAAWKVAPDPSVSGESAASLVGAGPVTSPMPGTVLDVPVAAGQPVAAGEPLVVVEAMKMEHTVRAPVAGRVGEVRVAPGQRVALDEVLVVIEEPG